MNTLSLPSDQLLLESAGGLRYLTAKLDAWEACLAQAPTWEPRHRLSGQLAWVRQEIETIQRHWTRKLVVVLAGPSGSGKSTLLNALAGRAISATGLQRPTTRQIIVYAQAAADVAHLLDDWLPDQVTLHTAPAAPGLEHIILVDTPDTNTIPQSQQTLALALERADLILAVLSAMNPKMADNVAFLAPFVRRVGPQAVVPVVTFVDRVPQDQLTHEILPDLARFFAQEWQIDVQRLWAVAAPRLAASAAGAADEQPLHGLNQFAELRDWLYTRLNDAQQVVDRRLARAEHLVALAGAACRRELEQCSAARGAAEQEMQALAKRFLAVAQRQVAREAVAQHGGLADLYRQLASRWWGPMGWVIAVWALALRLAHPWRRTGSSQGARSLGEELHWRAAIDRVYTDAWPTLADHLVAAGMAPVVRRPDFWQSESERLARFLAARGRDATDQAIQRAGRLLSLWPLQLVFNAPLLGMALWMAYSSIRSFLTQDFLPAGFYQSGLVALLTVWLLMFALLQLLLSGISGRLLRRWVADALRQPDALRPLDSLRQELAALDALARHVEAADDLS
jgi:energy-coupling factor transporter ATP-binding protein EcfA2